jgi:RluA family pseudouridine synthase
VNIHFEDEHLLVVEKPAGLLVHPTGVVRGGTLVEQVADYLGFAPGLPHRLDRDTTGLVVLTKTPVASASLGRQFAARRVAKQYLALVHGTPVAARISAPIGRDDAARPAWRVCAHGKPAETDLDVVRPATMSLVRLTPITGRTHQLRIHCAHVGHPIVGDDWYGSPTRTRLHLHAASLVVNHPADGRRIAFASSPDWLGSAFGEP